MRTRLRLAFILLPCGALALLDGCTALLGDFSVGDGGGGDATGDALGDASPEGGLDFLTCQEVSNERHAITQNSALNAYGLHITQLPNQSLRAVLADFPPPPDGGQQTAVFQAYTFSPQNINNVTPVALADTADQPLAVTRYGGPNPGFAVLYMKYDPSLTANFLWAARFPDDASSWTTPVKLPKVGNNLNDIQGSFTVLDPAADKYYVAFGSIASNQETIVAGAVSGSADTLTTIGTFPAQGNGSPYDLLTPGIAMAGSQPYILTNHNASGPPPGGFPELILVPGKQDVTIQPPQNLIYAPMALDNALDPLKANVAFLGADLSAEVGAYHVGQIPVSALDTLDPGTLPASSPPPTPTDAGITPLANLSFNSPPHWEVAGGAEQLVVVSATVDPLLQKYYGGLNFGWWDGASGQMRAYAAGPNRVLPDVPFIVNSDVTFLGLVGNLGQLEVAYLSTPTSPSNNYPPPPSDLWVAQIGCQKTQ
jgi:hypothetical protein